MNYKIKKASLDNIDSLIDLWKKLVRNQLKQDEYFNEADNFSITKEQVANILKNEDMAIFIAYNETSVFGFIEIWIQKKDFHFFEDDYAYIMHAFVKPEYRSFQVARGLHKKAEEWAISKNSKYLVADVFEFNQKTSKILNFLKWKPYRTRYIKEIDDKV